VLTLHPRKAISLIAIDNGGSHDTAKIIVMVFESMPQVNVKRQGAGEHGRRTEPTSGGSGYGTVLVTAI
jgi:hypothetical protein